MIPKLKSISLGCCLFVIACLPVCGQVITTQSSGFRALNAQESLQAFELINRPMIWYVWQIERTGYDLTNPEGFAVNDKIGSTLRMFGTNAVPRLIQELELSQTNGLSYGEVKFRIENTLVALGILGPDAKEAIPAILKLVSSDDNRIPALAIQTFGKIHSEDNVVVPALITLIKYPPDDGSGKDWARHKMALIVLGEYGDAAKAAVPIILKTLEDKKAFCGKEALEALQKIDPEKAKAF
jgi:hypothetical protein